MYSGEKMTQDKIPFPQLESWMHKRIPIKPVPLTEKMKSWQNEPLGTRIIEGILSRIAKKLHIFSPSFRFVTIKIVKAFVKLQFKIFNKLKVYGEENIPKTGCIFYVNHPGAYDPLVLLASNPYPAGALVAWSRSWFMDVIETLYGFLSRKSGESREKVVERMVRQILTKNRYFAIWPEGHPNITGLVEQGFSSIVRVYSVVNALEDRIPFVPVLLRGGGVYMHKPGIHWGPIDVHFFKPIFFDRDWLKHPDEGGKTHREITDYIMHTLARKVGQKTFVPNPRFENRRKAFEFPEPYNHHMRHHYHHINHEYFKRHTIYGIKNYEKEIFHEIPQRIVENIPENKLLGVIPAENFHSIYLAIDKFQCKSCMKKEILTITAHDLILSEPDYYDRFDCKCTECESIYSLIFDISSISFASKKKGKKNCKENDRENQERNKKKKKKKSKHQKDIKSKLR
jgi:1-acyl-sn-glycerol-3-phosphate acyltransferase